MQKNKLKIIYVPVSDLLPYAKNSKLHDAENVAEIAASIREFGFTNPVLIGELREIIAGHGRALAAAELGMAEIPCVVLSGLDEKQKRAYRIADNRLTEKSAWDLDMLADELNTLALDNYDLFLTGFDQIEIESLLAGSAALLGNEHWAKSKVMPDKKSRQTITRESAGSLFDKFVVPPFSVLNTQTGYWQERRTDWYERMGADEKPKGKKKAEPGLDPVLAELVCRWFAVPGFKVLEPYADGVTFGTVAGTVGLIHTGMDGREKNTAQYNALADAATSTYLPLASAEIEKAAEPSSIDMLFICPPCTDMETSTDNPEAMINIGPDEFIKQFRTAMKTSYGRLRKNRFAVVVVSETRGTDGGYLGMVSSTIKIMEAAGFTYYNEILLLKAVGTLSMRTARVFNSTRKVGAIHENVLVFYKGDPSKIKDTYGPVLTEKELENATEAN